MLRSNRQEQYPVYVLKNIRSASQKSAWCRFDEKAGLVQSICVMVLRCCAEPGERS